MRHFPFAFRFDASGRTANRTVEEHINDLILQLALTSPGERVNRPDFGSGLQQLVFSPNSDLLAGTTQMLLQGAIQQHLGDKIELQDLEVTNIDSTFEVRVQYLLKKTQETKTATFRSVAP